MDINRNGMQHAMTENRIETIQYQAVPVPDAEPSEPTVPLAHYLWIVRRHRWRILAFIAATMLGTYIVSTRLPPVYEAVATLDIDRKMPEGVVGQDANRESLYDSDQFLATQIGLIQSDAVLRPVAAKYDLLRLEKQLDGSDPPSKVAAFVGSLTTLKKLKVTRPPNTYLLLINYRSPNPQLAADVANAIARSYIETTYEIRFRSSADLSAFMERQLEELRAKMEKSSAALLQFEKELNVISPEEKTNILSSRLLQLNTEFTNAQADRVRKQSAFQAVSGGSLEAAQVSTQGEVLKTLTEKLTDTEEKFADVNARFGPNHPEYKKLAAQLAELRAQFDLARQNIVKRITVEYRQAEDRERMLDQAVKETKAEFDRLNSRSFEYQARKREADADKKFYEELIQRIKEASINAGFQNSAIRLANLARPPAKPVFPDLKLNLLLAFVFGTLVAFGGAFVSDVLDNTLRDPEQVRRKLNTDVVGILPLAMGRAALVGSNGNGHGTALMRLESLRGNKRVGAYVEAIRTLRNSILLRSLDGRLKSLLITSAAPKEGKSTTAVHLALAHAEQRHRTLLIDCDLRRPSVHKYFDIANDSGMSDVALGTSTWRSVIKEVNPTDLHIISSGRATRRAADLVAKVLSQILQEGADEYDLIVVDAPPMLGFPEPLQMATTVDGVLVVTLAGETNRQAVTSVLSTLTRLRANVTGIVLNKMNRDLSDGYYYYGYYAKYNKHYYDNKAKG